MEIQTPINHFKAVISDYQAEFTLSGEGTEELLTLKLVSEIDDSIRQGKYTLNDLPEKIKEFYQDSPILRMFFDELHQNVEKDLMKITEEGDFIFIKKIQMSKGKIIDKKFILSTKSKEMTEKDIISNMQKELKDLKNKMKAHTEQIKQLQKENQMLKKKAENDEILSKVFSKMELMQESIKSLQNPPYCFSRLLKYGNVSILQNDKVAQKLNQVNAGNVIVENSKGRKFQKISFKMKKVVGWINFGIGLFDSLQLGSFASNYGNKVSYSIANGKQVYLLNKDSINHNLTLTTNDIVDINLTKDTIIFTKRGSYENVITLNLEFTDEQWKNTVFFACLWNPGDAIEIIQ